MTPAALVEFVRFYIRNRFPGLITGRPGIGKSDIVAQAAKAEGARLIISHPVVSDPTDYKGLPFPKADGTADFLPYGDLNELIHADENTVFFLDDLGQASPAVQAACMQLLLARRINGHVISDNVTFLAATNRKGDKAGVTGILEPVKSRFYGIHELEASVDDWVKWALRENQPTELIAFVKFRPDYIEKFEPSKEIVNSPSPRTIAYVGKQQNAGLAPHMEFDAFKGAAGETFASEYQVFLEIMRTLPSLEQIILNPKTAPVPDETQPGIQYSVAYALAKKATPQNIQAILTYLDRMPVEFSVSSVKYATERDSSICNTRHFQQWASDKKDVFN